MTQPTPFDTETDTRWGVFRRERGRRWSLVVHAGTEDAAHRLLMRLMDDPKHRGSADWRVGRVGGDVTGKTGGRVRPCTRPP